jgi:hypothetical protein
VFTPLGLSRHAPCSLCFWFYLKKTRSLARRGKEMETVINHENRNELAKRVISGEVPVEKATMGLARIEVKIFYRKLDRASQAMNFKQSKRMTGIPASINKANPANDYAFFEDFSGPFTI